MKGDAAELLDLNSPAAYRHAGAAAEPVWHLWGCPDEGALQSHTAARPWASRAGPRRQMAGGSVQGGAGSLPTFTVAAGRSAAAGGAVDRTPTALQ